MPSSSIKSLPIGPAAILLVTATLVSTNQPHFDASPWRFAAASDTMSSLARARAIAKKFLSVEQAEGVGARVRRSVGRPEVSPAH